MFCDIIGGAAVCGSIIQYLPVIDNWQQLHTKCVEAKAMNEWSKQ